MHIAAIIANVAQWGIILSIFFIRGLDLGGLVIGLLFVLMTVPLINFLALFFPGRAPTTPDAARMADNGMIKREAMRIRYPESRCPALHIGATAFAVIDLSEGGVRIRASLATPFKKKVAGEIHLLCGEQIHFKGSLLRREDSETVFHFIEPVGTALIMAEKNTLAADTTQADRGSWSF
jgi:hypothetical protein